MIVAALLGAEEFGFATAPLVSVGCVMMRACHSDTCPVGVATQNPELRLRFAGLPEHVVNFMLLIAGQVREYLAMLGFRTLAEVVGQAELLRPRVPEPSAQSHRKASFLDLAPLLHVPDLPAGAARRKTRSQRSHLHLALDNTLIQLAERALADGSPVRLDLPVRNVNRAVGTMLGFAVTRRWGGDGLPADTITLGLRAGNVIGYGATGGELFLRGVVGERFCVRNSGATAVAEGTGDHGCEYMTGGRVVVLGPVGRNFAAGMSGGIAYLLDPDPALINSEMVDVEQVDGADCEFLADVLSRYQSETGSPVAAALLEDWATALPRLRRVMPKDYKRVLAATRRARRDGQDVAEAVMAAARV